jgi:hypothetical protein
MNIKNRQQFLLILTIVVVALWGGDTLIVSPLTASWKARAARIAELRRSIEKGTSLLERERSIRSRWENMRTNTLPNVASVAEAQFFRASENWERDSQISITSTKPQWKRNNDDYMTYECRFDATGDLPTLTRFLYDVEKDPMALKVDAVEIASRDNNGQQMTLGLLVSGLLLNPPEP